MRRSVKKILRKIFVILILAVSILNSEAAFCADIESLEREALILRVELNRLGSNGDPFKKEAILQKIIDTCKGTEEAENAYFDLADLYLEGFQQEMRQEARETLELCLRNYPNSKRASIVKCKLIDLYDENNKRREQLINEIKNDKNVPAMIKLSFR